MPYKEERAAQLKARLNADTLRLHEDLCALRAAILRQRDPDSYLATEVEAAESAVGRMLQGLYTEKALEQELDEAVATVDRRLGKLEEAQKAVGIAADQLERVRQYGPKIEVRED